MRSRAAAALVLALVAPGCGGDVTTVDVHLANDLLCPRTPALVALQSVGVEVVRETQAGLAVVDELTSCTPIDRTREVADLVRAFDEAGVIVQGAPAESRTLLRFVGYTSASCLRDTERVCGITCPLIRVGDIPAEGVTANFICEPLREQTEAYRLYAGCLNLEQLTEEARQNICSRVE